MISDEEEALVLQALGSQREGAALRQWLSKRLLRVMGEAADVRALSIEHGRRLMCAELLRAIETPESADGRDDLATHVHRPRKPVEYDVRSRRRVPDVSPDDASELERALGRAGRGARADRRLAAAGDQA